MSNAAMRVIVKFRIPPESGAEALPQLCDAVTQRTGARLVRPPSPTGRAIFQVDPESDVISLIEHIRQLPSVEYVERDVIDHDSPG